MALYPEALAEEFKKGTIQVTAPKACQFGTHLASFKLNGKTPCFQTCRIPPPDEPAEFVRATKGILSSIEKEGENPSAAVKDGPRRSINFRVTKGSALWDLLNSIQDFSQETIRKNWPVWKKPEVPRLPGMVKLMLQAGEDPEQISMEEIESTNVARTNGFAMPVISQNVPIKDKPTECYPPTWKTKIQVRDEKLPAAKLAHMWVEDGQWKIDTEIDYHTLVEQAFDCVAIVQVAGIQFKADQWRVLLTVIKLVKMGNGLATNDVELLMDGFVPTPGKFVPKEETSAEPSTSPKTSSKRPHPSDPQHQSFEKKPKIEQPAINPEGVDPEDMNSFA